MRRRALFILSTTLRTARPPKAAWSHVTSRRRAVLVVALAAAHCRGTAPPDPYTPNRVAAVVASLRYHKVIVHPYAVADTIPDPAMALGRGGDAMRPSDAVDGTIDDPRAVTAICHRSTVDFLKAKRIFASIQVSRDATADQDTLTVDATVESLRIAGGGEKFWTGKSHMSLVVVAKDWSGAIVARRTVDNHDGPGDSVWPAGGTGYGLPGDMGLLVADAIVRIAGSDGQ